MRIFKLDDLEPSRGSTFKLYFDKIDSICILACSNKFDSKDLSQFKKMINKAIFSGLNTNKQQQLN